MGKYGWKINNYMAATIVGKNTGVRDRYSYTEALLHKSLFTSFLQMNGMTTDKSDESTRDIICIDFQFGLRGYDEEMAHLKNVKANAERIQDDQKRAEKLAAVEDHIRFAEERKELYKHMSKDDIRRELYVNGAPITYTYKNKKTGEIIHEETIEYKMLYRNPSKAKEGSCLFIRKELYDKARDWLTMGLADKMDPQNAKIVELSAYAPLSTSSIEGTVKILPEEILILEEQESTFRTIADIVKAQDYEVVQKVLDEDYFRETGKNRFINQTVTKKKCIVEREETDVVNAMWDGQALIESSTLPSWCNGMGLLRNHFFKSCAFKANIQLFLQDYCRDHGLDYDTFEIEDMFGIKHLAKNIRVITTDSSCKWKKFVSLMGGTLPEAYKYWVDRLEKDGFVFGIVKTDHPSKLGSVQQMSYQMINTLPCTKEDIDSICKTSIDYVERMKEDDDLFVEYLKKVANPVNHYEMLIDLYHHNPDFKYTKFWRVDKTRIIGNYINHLRKGKITVEGDNLTVCGNPYGLLLYTVGEDWTQDPTLLPEDGVIQVYTRRFEDGEYLCGIRSPNNSSNNLGFYKNVYNILMDKYFDFSPNIMAVNCNRTDVQARLNGMDSMGRF